MTENPPLFDTLPGPDRDRMISLQRALRRSQGNVKVNFVFVGISNGVLDKALSRAGRLAFYSWAFGRDIATSKALTLPEMFNLVAWLGPRKTGDERSDPWTYSREFIRDLPILIQLFSGGVGQLVMPLSKEVWHCQVCDTTNGIQRAICVSCGADRDLPAQSLSKLSKDRQRKALHELGFDE